VRRSDEKESRDDVNPADTACLNLRLLTLRLLNSSISSCCTDLTHREEDRTARGVERISHDRIAYLRLRPV